MSSDISNWHYVVIELFVAGVLAFFFWVIQYGTSERVRELTEQKATHEQKKKEFECQRIIRSLQDIQEEQQNLETYLTGYNVDKPTNEMKFEIQIFGHSLENCANSSINTMYDAIGQLQDSLNDIPLRNDLSGYLRRFYVLPVRILKDNFPIPRQKHTLDLLLSVIKEQTGEIQKFIERFKKEMDSSLSEKGEEEQSFARDKYFNAPKL